MSADQDSGTSAELKRCREILREYITSRSETFVKLNDLREKVRRFIMLAHLTTYTDQMTQGWKNEKADEYFKTQRNRADTASHGQQKKFFKMMGEIGKELQDRTRALKIINSEVPSVLDTCAAPGGFVSAALRYNPTASVCAITLPAKLGGHPVLVPYGGNDPRVNIRFMDITKLGVECGLSLEELQPDMTPERPYLDEKFDLVFCDGQVLRTNKEHRDGRTEQYAATRLACSQLIVALNRIKSGGTLVMLLHGVEALASFNVLAKFAQFADIQLFKPARCHATRSSFYLVAKNVDVTSRAAKAAIEEWKYKWKRSTLVGSEEKEGSMNVQDLDAALTVFGERFIQLANPIWDTQRKALEEAEWNKDAT